MLCSVPPDLNFSEQAMMKLTFLKKKRIKTPSERCVCLIRSSKNYFDREEMRETRLVTVSLHSGNHRFSTRTLLLCPFFQQTPTSHFPCSHLRAVTPSHHTQRLAECVCPFSATPCLHSCVFSYLEGAQ